MIDLKRSSGKKREYVPFILNTWWKGRQVLEWLRCKVFGLQDCRKPFIFRGLWIDRPRLWPIPAQGGHRKVSSQIAPSGFHSGKLVRLPRLAELDAEQADPSMQGVRGFFLH